MKVVYLASPYRNKAEWVVCQNIQHAQRTARLIWQLGAVCLSPCGNTAFFGGSDIPDEVWLKGDIEMLKRCDALFMNEGSVRSNGCRAEESFARNQGLPIFWELDKLEEWLKNDLA